MADSSDRNKAVQYELAQDDPFAELTRIMGHDPREVVPLQPEAPEPADDLALDLENELMGHLTDEGNPGAAGYDREMASWQQEFAGAQYEPAEASAPEGAPDFESALEALLEETAPESEQPDGYPDYPPAGEPDYPAAGENEAEGFADPAFAPQVEEAAPDNDLPLHEASSEAEFADFEPEAAENPPEAVAFPEPVELPASPDATPDPFEEEQGTYQPGVDVFAAPEDVPLAQENEVTGASHGFSEERQEPEDQEPEGFADEEWAFIDWQEVTPTGQDAFAAQPQQPWSDAQDERARSPSPEEPSTSAAPEPRYGEAWPPEIDTVEVPEDTVAIADNLDIPEVSYRDEVKPAAQFDEIEEILAGAFGETDLSADVWAETASVDEQTGAPAAREDDYVEDYLAAGIPAAAGFGTAAAAYAQGADSPGERWAAPEGAIPPLAPQPGTEPPAGPRRRLPGGPVLMAIGALAVVVLLGGGATLLAFSLGGDDSEPVVIAADDSPIKIRPENPGGIQIPNQDNQVYRRVSGEEVPDARPAQAELIETTEEPVELTPPPGVREANLRLPSEAAPQEEAQVSGEAQSPEAETSQGAKIAERLTPAAGAEESAPEQDITALAPRRVRSMVVRPDGSIVPREMPEPAEASAASESSDTARPDGQAGEGQQVARTTAGAQNSAEPAESVAAAVPEQGPIPPSRPAGIAAASNQQRAPQADAGRQTPQASQQVAAVANPPAQATAAPSSEWSVQIASQPTVEGAQQSYQQLAQRFGSMLQGRGVNIVQAEIEGRGTYYRVRIPSSSKEDAIELCSQLKSAGGSCFVSQ